MARKSPYKITLGSQVRRRLPSLPYVTVFTTFVTEAGPARGTTWFNRTEPNTPPGIVDRLTRGGARVIFVDGREMTRAAFLKAVSEGELILVGIENMYPTGRIETGHNIEV